LIYKAPEYKKVLKYDWEHPDFDPSEDKFMQRFDENGNFVNIQIGRKCNKDNDSFLSRYAPVKHQIE
jgi:hypothetical protein